MNGIQEVSGSIPLSSTSHAGNRVQGIRGFLALVLFVPLAGCLGNSFNCVATCADGSTHQMTVPASSTDGGGICEQVIKNNCPPSGGTCDCVLN